MHQPHAETREVEIEGLGERLSALRLCDAAALATVRRSLEVHGQIAAEIGRASCRERVLQVV